MFWSVMVLCQMMNSSDALIAQRQVAEACNLLHPQYCVHYQWLCQMKQCGQTLSEEQEQWMASHKQTIEQSNTMIPILQSDVDESLDLQAAGIEINPDFQILIPLLKPSAQNVKRHIASKQAYDLQQMGYVLHGRVAKLAQERENKVIGQKVYRQKCKDAYSRKKRGEKLLCDDARFAASYEKELKRCAEKNKKRRKLNQQMNSAQQIPVDTLKSGA